MNLAESLRETLSEHSTGRIRERLPKLHPDLVFRRNIEDGEPIVAAMVRGSDRILRFDMPQWRLIELFNGVRSYEEVARLYAQRYGVLYPIPDLREFTAKLEDTGIWQNTWHGGAYHKHTRQSRWGDVSHITFSAWDPNRTFDWIHPRLKWIYTRWFTGLTLLAFAFMAAIIAANWGRITQDSLAYFDFRTKSAADLTEFWFLFLVVGLLHESAHGLTCRHYGGEVHSMGFQLVYFLPAFFVDVTEAWVYASRWQRFTIIVAGVWSELILGTIATFVWWGTPSGSDVHDIAYKLILLNSFAVVILNLNPLVKLDGYYALAEIVGFSDIKEKSTAFLSELLRSRLFRLPVPVQYVPRRRRLGYLLYAVVSGFYSYALLFAFLGFSHNIFVRFLPVWAFVPTTLLGLLIFRSRIGTFLNFLRTVYLDKKERIHTFFPPTSRFGLGALLIVLLLLPIWRQTVTARFVLQPDRTQLVRTLAPGQVTAVFVREGQQVHAGDPLLRMTSPPVESKGEAAPRGEAAAGGAAGTEEPEATGRELTAQAPQAPFDGAVLTPGLRNLLGSYLPAGAPIAEIADMRRMRARLYILGYAIGPVSPGQRVALLLDGTYSRLAAKINSIEPNASPLPNGLESVRQIGQAEALRYYVADAVLPNKGALLDGMTGTAKITIARCSLASLVWKNVREFVDRKLW